MSNLKEILINKKICKSVWFMRQAGRYLPEFKKIRSQNQNFINLCLNSELSSEIILQPIKRFDLYSAIIFSDILIVLYALNQKVEFLQNHGPKLENFNLNKFLKNNDIDFIEKLKPVYKAIEITRKRLNKEKSLISFIGAPWTLLVYMIGAKLSKKEIDLKLINKKKDEISLVLEKLINYLCLHIDNQIKAGADVVVLDGMQGGTAATQEVFIENVGQPTLACIRPAVDALQDLNVHRDVQLIISGGIRNGADVSKALALGADAVSIGSAAMIAIGDNDPKWEKEYNKLGSTAGAYDDWHEGNDPAGISTQNPKLMKRLDPIKAGKKLSNYLKVMTLEAQTIARACGKNDLHNLEPEDLCALTVEAAAMARVPLAGTNWVPGLDKNIY